ncbi:uncharacterized protein K460DRAFT_296082 [Cucurbitaria berberidis CBS 394.84]|uniref:Uncharacterized protein n=1 Tax=Cucurbitaria berberidis CBS 394.84 TaxID=1168544 RepID=A0A9P4L407_9PLEO|nr:uncharacterized protein K460DRAFT_296082 [Cucurbitaria berberidis CBS 394.84]KAF1840368.1 hypothetical protein K460DRAFT_296082 [Cucurbitaria berberidis CBS 394.84]
MGHRIRHDLLYRLRWNIFAALDDIEIATGPHDQTTNLPFLGHPFADEFLTEPPLSRIQVCIRECEQKYDSEYFEDEQYRYQSPAALTINNEGNHPITLGQFVTQAHAYLNRNMKEIKKIKSENYGELVERSDGSQGRVVTNGHPVSLPNDIKFFFSWVWVMAINGNVTLGIYTYAEGEGFDRSIEVFWTNRLKNMHRHEQERQA